MIGLSGEVHFAAHYAPTMDFNTAKAMKISRFHHTRQILTAETLPDAVRGADTYATQNIMKGPLSMGFVFPLSPSLTLSSHLGLISTIRRALTDWVLCRLLRSAKWRMLPATPAQKAFVAKRWGMRSATLVQSDTPGETSFPDEVKNLTKGQAANVITRLKHGAQVRCLSFHSFYFRFV